MLPPPQVNTLPIETESSNGIFKGQVPSILTSAWQSERGDVAVIVLNIGEDTLKTTVPLSPYSQYVWREYKEAVLSTWDW